VPVADRHTTVTEYLSYWLREVVSINAPLQHEDIKARCDCTSCQYLARNDLINSLAGTFGTSFPSADRSAYAAPTGMTSTARGNSSAAQSASAANGRHQPDRFNTFMPSYVMPSAMLNVMRSSPATWPSLCRSPHLGTRLVRDCQSATSNASSPKPNVPGSTPSMSGRHPRLPPRRTPRPALVRPRPQARHRRIGQDRSTGQRPASDGRHQDRRLG
jgi:hypothetical protein